MARFISALAISALGARLAAAQPAVFVAAQDPRVTRCMIRQLYRYAQGRLDSAGEEAALAQLSQRLDDNGHRFKRLLVELVASEGFRFAAAPTP